MYCFSAYCKEARLDKSAKYHDFYVIDSSTMPALQYSGAIDQVDLVDKLTGQRVGELKIDNGKITLDGNNSSQFLISKMPSDPGVLSFDFTSSDNLIFDTHMDLPYCININAKGLIYFTKSGLTLNRSVHVSGAQELRIEGKLIINGILKVENIKKIQVLKTGNLSADYLQISSNIDSVMQNMGTIHIKKDLVAEGAWYNNASGKVIVEEYFGGKFSNYYEDGETTVHGLASIKANNGRMTNKFSASYGIISLDGNLDVANTASFYAQHHLTLLTQNSMNLLSKSINLNPSSQQFKNIMSRELYGKIRNIEKGIFITAKKNILTQDSFIKSANTKTSIRGKNYVQRGGTISSGFFDNNNISVVVDKKASLQGEIYSHFDAFIRAKTTELKGSRHVDKTLLLYSDKINQGADDRNKAHSVVIQGQDIRLKGHTELAKDGQMSVNATKSFVTKDQCEIKNGNIVAQCEKAELSGNLENTSLAVSAHKDLVFKKKLKANLVESQVEAGKIIHQTGSDLKVQNTNSEKAKSGISVQKGAKVKAKNNMMKTKNLLGYVRQSGDISVDESHMVDTGFYVGALGSTKAKNININADWLSLNLLSSLKAETIEIDTLVNLSALSHLNGTRSVTINALLANVNLASIFHTNNYASRSLFNVDYSLTMPDFSTYFSDIKENLPKKLLSTGFSVLNHIPGADPYVNIAKFAYDMPTKLYSFANTARSVWKEDRSNFWRPSRMSKFLSIGADLGMQGYKVYNTAKNFQDGLKKFESPNDKKTNDENSDNIAEKTFFDYLSEYKDFIPDIIPGSKTVDALYDVSGGINLMGDIKTNCYSFEDTSFNICNHKEINAYSGKDKSSGIFKSLKTHTIEDLLFSGDKYSLYEIDTKSKNAQVTVDNAVHAASLCGDFIARGNKVDKHEGSFVKARNIILDSKEQTISNGKSRADKVFSATSDKETIEGQSSEVKAGVSVNFDGRERFEKQEGSLAAAPVVRRHGDSSTLAGSVDGASQMLITTSGQGKLDAAQVSGEINTPIYIMGSGFVPTDEKPLPIAKSGQVIAPTNAKLNGDALDLRGKGISNLDELCEQKGAYESWNIKDYVKVETDQDLRLTNSLNSASQSFELITNHLSFAKGVTWDAPKFLLLKSISDRKVIFEGGNRLQGGVYVEFKANGDIDGLVDKRITRDKHGNVIDVEFKPCIFCGGEGIEYEYTDPETGEKSIRKLAVVVESEKQYNQTGVQYVALADIFINGKEGLNEFIDTQECVHKKSKKKIEIVTKSCLPYYSTPGKLLREYGGAGLKLSAAVYNLGEGGDTIGTGPVIRSPGAARHVIKVKKKKYGIFKTKKKEEYEIDLPIIVNNLGDQKVRFWAIDENGNRYNLDFAGLVYSGDKGTLQIIGHDVTLARPILNNSKRSTSFKPFVKPPSLGTYTVTAGVKRKSKNDKYRRLGSGSIDTDKLELDLTGDLHQNNAYRISNPGGGSVKIDGTWYQNGAQLEYSREQDKSSLYARKAEVGAKFGHREKKGYSWISGNSYFRNTHFEVNKLDQTAATTDIEDATGYINNITARDKRDEEKSIHYGGSIAYDFASKKLKGSVNIGAAHIRSDLHESGVKSRRGDLHLGSVKHVKAPKKVRQSFSIGLSGTPEKVKGVSLRGQRNDVGIGMSLGFSKDENCSLKANPESFNVKCKNYSLGLSFDENNIKDVKLGYQGDKHGFSLSFNPQFGSETSEKGLFKIVGKFSYSDVKNNIHINDIPIITGINRKAWEDYEDKFLSFLSVKKDKEIGPDVEVNQHNFEQPGVLPLALDLDSTNPVDDLSFHNTAEYIIKSSIKTVLYRVMTLSAMPIPWPVKVASMTGSFMPQKSIDDIIQSHLRMIEAENEGDALGLLEYRAQFESDVNMKVLREFLTIPQRITDAAFEQLDTTFPSLEPTVADALRQGHEESISFFHEATRENSPQQKAIINSLF
jgi:hypothetical protein